MLYLLICIFKIALMRICMHVAVSIEDGMSVTVERKTARTTML